MQVAGTLWQHTNSCMPEPKEESRARYLLDNVLRGSQADELQDPLHLRDGVVDSTATKAHPVANSRFGLCHQVPLARSSTVLPTNHPNHPNLLPCFTGSHSLPALCTVDRRGGGGGGGVLSVPNRQGGIHPPLHLNLPVVEQSKRRDVLLAAFLHDIL